MRNVDISVFNIGRTQVNREAVERWMQFIGANNFDVPTEEEVTDPALLIAMAAKRCYMSFEPDLNPNVTKVRKNWTDYLDNILKSGHGSVMEHSVYTFAIENVSRVFTGEMNRHRAGVGISEGSMRYIRYRDIPWWMPPSMRLTQDEEQAIEAGKKAFILNFDHNSDDVRRVFVHEKSESLLPEPLLTHWRIALKKLKTQAVFREHYTHTESNYTALQDIWSEELAPESKFHGKKQVTSMIRRIIPMGVATGGVWTMNIRAVRHIIALRASEGAEEEIAHVFSIIAKQMVENEPMLLGDFVQDDAGFWSPKYAKV